MRPTLALLAALLCCPLAHAELYRYVDDQGRVTYSDRPPSDGRPAERLPYAPSPPKVPSPRPPAQPNGATPAPGVKAAPTVDPALRATLDAELARREAQLHEAQKALKEGEEVRLGNERNYQKYLDRIQGLRDEVAARQREVEQIRQEINRLSQPAAGR